MWTPPAVRKNWTVTSMTLKVSGGDRKTTAIKYDIDHDHPQAVKPSRVRHLWVNRNNNSIDEVVTAPTHT